MEPRGATLKYTLRIRPMGFALKKTTALDLFPNLNIITCDYLYYFSHRKVTSTLPKPFSEQEKEFIRAQLLEKGKQLIEKHGIKKTSIDDIIDAVGISKGAFYLFFESKEELLLAILEQLEEDFRSRIFDFSISTKGATRHQLGKLLQDTLLTWDQYPLLKNLKKSDYDYLARKLPPERIQAHTKRDDEFVDDFIKKIKRDGVSVKASPRVVSNLMKSLFFVSLHRDELGQEAYMETMKVLADLVARYIIEGA